MENAERRERNDLERVLECVKAITGMGKGRDFKSDWGMEGRMCFNERSKGMLLFICMWVGKGERENSGVHFRLFPASME